MQLRAVRAFLVLGTLAWTATPSAFANILFSNTTTDTGDSLTFASGPYTEIGDQIHLFGFAGYASSATVQFYNSGTASGVFDATLKLFNVGAPVGSQFGSFTVTGISAPLGGASGFDVVFSGWKVAIPDDLIFTVSVSNVSAGVDLGLTMFDPPTIGSSDNTFAIVNDGAYSQIATANENVYFELATPEPSTFLTLASALGLLAGFQRVARRRLSRS